MKSEQASVHCRCGEEPTLRQDRAREELTIVADAGDRMRASDPIREAVDASGRSLLLLWDAVAYVANVVVGQNLPWLAETADTSPLATGLPRNSACEFAAVLISWTDSVGKHIPTAVLAPWHAANNALIMGFQTLAIDIERAVAALRSCAAMALQSFAETYPQHHAVIAERDPLITALLVLVFTAVVAWELYGCCRVAWLVVRRVFGLVFHMLLLPSSRCRFRNSDAESAPDFARAKSKTDVEGRKGAAERLIQVHSGGA
eukprot:CAMPEP_0117529400 /NCGR_PEP_ID=MMETSP0784-20121206/37813_1 /TAXON_ID=39447 /ORGANISM="" /LENGTH=259 /DNA_ID=CAMNT_0005325721 /DNA_START=128 /DNA_END=907 /DNA_ORIENTATION=+